MTSEDCVKRIDAINGIANTHFAISSEDYNELIRMIMNLPSITPQPKVGKWDILGDIWECSRCKTMVMGYDGLNYCPNCGAKMEEEE